MNNPCARCRYPEEICKCLEHGLDEAPSFEDALAHRGLNKHPQSKEFKEAIEGHNNGGKTDYYDLCKDWNDCQDIIEGKDMSWNIANIFKACFRFGNQNHSSKERDLNKIIYFTNRELKRIKNG